MRQTNLSSTPPAGFVPSLIRLLPFVAASAVVGAVVFVVVQVAAGLPPITHYLGQQIVKKGGYAAGLAPLIGWGIHLGVSAQYAALFGVLAALPVWPADKTPRLVATLGVALLLGWLTTLVTVPAIDITIRLFSGQGFPNSLKPLNTGFGLAFWNHLLFFVLCWLGCVVSPRKK